MRTSTTRTRRAVVAAAATVLALSLAACGATEDEEGVASAGGGPAAGPTADARSEEEQQLAYTRCLRENGADIQDGSEDEEMKVTTEQDPALDAAAEKCADLAPAADSSKPLTAEELAMFRAFAGCMREQGIDMPDPDPETGISPPTGKVDQGAMMAAAGQCQQHLGLGGGGQ